MANIYLSQPDMLSVDTQVVHVRTLPDGRSAIAVAENPLRPAGGGQPADHGVIAVGEQRLAVEDVVKAEGETWLAFVADELGEGVPIRIEVDADRRHRLSQAHSLTHLAMASVREVVDGYESKGADISDDGAELMLRFRSSQPVSQPLLHEIDRRTRSYIARAIPISIERSRSIAHAESLYPNWRIDPDLNLNGRIRVIVIDGVDANPCSGSHVKSTAEIGPYALIRHAVDRAGVNILRLRKNPCWTYWY